MKSSQSRLPPFLWNTFWYDRLRMLLMVEASLHITVEMSFSGILSFSSSDTWKKAANTYYVEQMASIFHDDYVLEYFEHTFPEIFDN